MSISYSRTPASLSSTLSLHRGNSGRRRCFPRLSDSTTAPFVRWLMPSWRCYSSPEPNQPPLLPSPVVMRIFSAGCLGTAAIFLGQWLNVDPYGNLHFDPEDVLLGVLAAVPFVMMQFLIFRLRSTPQSGVNRSTFTPKKRKGRTKLVETRQDLLSNALVHYTVRRETEYFTKGLSSPITAFVSLVGEIPSTMLCMGVGLTATGNWFRDRLIEADIQSYIPATIDDIGQLGKCCALLCLSISLLLATSRAALKPPTTAADFRVFGISQQDTEKLDLEDDSVEKEIMDSLRQSIPASIRLSRTIRAVLSFCFVGGSGMAFVASGNLISPLSTAMTVFLSDLLFVQQSLAETTIKVQEAIEGQLNDRPLSLLSTIQSKPYLKMKSNFRQKIRQEEAKQTDPETSEDSVHDSSSEEQMDASESHRVSGEMSDKLKQDSDPQKQSTSDSEAMPIDLDLPSLAFVFQITLRDLDMGLSYEGLQPSTQQILTDEKNDVVSLLERARKLQSDDQEKEKTTSLNFYRDVKDRYKGGGGKE